MPDPLTTFGLELSRLLAERGMSLRALERASGVSHGHLSVVMRGRRSDTRPMRPTDELVERVAAALDVEPDTFADYRRRRALEQHPEAIDRLYYRRKAS